MLSNYNILNNFIISYHAMCKIIKSDIYIFINTYNNS